MAEALVVFVAYLLGAIPFGLIFGRLFGSIDVRTEGSRNIGAANVARVVGKTAGLLTLLFDAFKGSLAVVLASLIVGKAEISAVCGLSALLGHTFPLFLKFRGGKGVATGLGVFMVLAPLSTLGAIGLFTIVFAGSRIVSLSSLVSAVGLAAFCVLLEKPQSVIMLSSVTCVLVFVRHRSNIIRVLGHKEPRF
ncbi:MAG: glycerol-3-phosphate 1-O-acyltransferase PlsY [Myxococcota bacterium]|nr:glycerol-3-phosphate 1-O-acyltransferase PlsY [Myxococcota bacterium]